MRSILELEGQRPDSFRRRVFMRTARVKQTIRRARELKSLFKPKSAQVLRVMLRDPAGHGGYRARRDRGVSLGHVSNVPLVCWTGNGARCPTKVCSFRT